MDLPPVAFLPQVGSKGVFKGGDNLVDGAASGLTVSRKNRPLVVVNVAGTVGFLQGVFKTFLWRHSDTVVSGEFTLQGYISICLLTCKRNMCTEKEKDAYDF